jgi:hypothetical protein
VSDRLNEGVRVRERVPPQADANWRSRDSSAGKILTNKAGRENSVRARNDKPAPVAVGFCATTADLLRLADDAMDKSPFLAMTAVALAACGSAPTMTPSVGTARVDNPLTSGSALTFARELYDASMCSRGAVESRYELEVDARQICVTLRLIDDPTGPVRFRVASDEGSTDPFLLVPTGDASPVNECALDRSKPLPVVAQMFRGCTENSGVVTAKSREVILLNVLPDVEEHVANWSLETKTVTERPAPRSAKIQ